jgi:hypothetical protein
MAVKRKPLLADTKDGTFETVSGLYKAHYPADKPWNYRLEMGDSWVQYEAQFEESEHLDIEVETTRTGIKETITLFDDQAPTKLVWNVSKSGTGITMMPPTAVDARGKDVPVTVTEGKGTITYDVNVEGVTWPVVVDPTSNVEATNDGYAYGYNFVYATSRDAATATGKSTVEMFVGQLLTGGSIYITDRAFLSFDIPDMSSISAASLFLEGAYDFSTTDFEIYIHTSTYSNPLVVGDYPLFDGRQTGGAHTGTVLNNTWNSSSYSATWNEIEFNVSGLLSIINSSGATWKIALISKEDYNNSAPTGNEYLGFHASATADKEPYLELTYEAAAGGGRRPRARYHGV